MLTCSPDKAPDQFEDVTLRFEQGRPRALNGKTMSGEEIIASLNVTAGRHGVGRVDLVENRRVGMKSRGLYETPGGTVIVEALRGLEELVLDRETRHYRDHLGLTFAELVYDGRWFTPLREALWACASKIAEKLDGEVVVRLFKGHATAVQRRSPNSLYAENIVTFEQGEIYDQKDAGGFIKLLSLPERIRALKARGQAK
jgi:argininosuccinate synthase